MPKYIKGLNKDTGHVDQTEGTYRYAKNAILNDRAGSIQNEHGTTSHVDFLVSEINTPDNPVESITVIGTIEITDDKIVAFAVSVSSGLVTSIIYLIEKSTWDNYPQPETRVTVLLVTNPQTALTVNNNDQIIDVDLKFNKNFPIEGTYKINPNGDLLVYWTDNKNPPRALNVTRQRSHVFTQANQINSLYTGIIYGKDPEESPNLNYIDRLNLFPHAGPVPHIEFKEVKNGGALKTGTYYLFLAYVDADATQTNYITSSLPVPIVEDIESVLPIERYDGASADSQTGKMISWTVSNINTDYEFIRPTIVSRINNVENAYILNDVETRGMGDSVTVSFSMLEGYASGSTDAVIIDAVAYDTAKTLTQLDSVLYLGNLSGTKDVGYQKNANFIKLHSVIEEWYDFDPFSLTRDNLDNGFFEDPPLNSSKESGYRDLYNIVNKRGYMRDEVYAFYIAFILNDGSMSYAYHIPGREKLKNVSKNNVLNIGTQAFGELDALVDEDDPITLAIDLDLWALSSQVGKLFHFYDFSKLDVDIVLGENINKPKMNYWENLNEFYPNTDDYKVYDGDLDTGTDLRQTNVRHHHFPSNLNEDRSTLNNYATINEPTVNQETVTTNFYFTFTDAETAGGNHLVLGNNNLPDTWGEGSTPGDDLFDLFPQTIGPGGSFEGATFLYPTNALITGVLLVGYHQSQSSTDGDADYVQIYGTIDPDDPTHLLVTYSSSTDLFIGTDEGFLCWSVTSVVGSSSDVPINQVIRPMGFQLKDVKIPADIVEQVQGFRIYYASRDHNNRRILGQDHIKQTILSEVKDIGGCGEGTSSSAKEDFLVSAGNIYNRGKINTGAFHDFYLLNGGYGEVSKGLSAATHVNKLHNFTFYSFKGPGHNYYDVDALTEANSCQTAGSTTAFHMNHASEIEHDTFRHIPLREKCRTYVNGDSIYDGRALGFGKRIYNIGGEKNIALAFSPNRLLSQPYFPAAGSGAIWHAAGGVQPGVPSELITSAISNKAVNLPLYNLCAFKTDMYMSVDTQRLVWTGYEVVGEELNNFIEKPNQHGRAQASTDDQQFGTPPIFGGDTFICRHGYRISHRPEVIGTQARDKKTVISTICESTDNINLRHEESNASACFPGAPLKRVLDLKADVNLTDTVNMKYNADYSLGTKDVKFPPALPLRDISPSVYPNRVQRSAKADNTSIVDNYRVFLAAEIKDLPRNRGSLWNLVSFNNLLYMHMEDSLFRTKGKQTMQLADGSEAFLGSGNIFEQEPDEMVQTESGYGGTQSQWAATVTSQGYFCLDYNNKKVYLVTDKITDIGRSGMSKWFRDNIPFGLEDYGIENFDNPIVGVGFHAVWDEKYNRILLTKRDIVPTTIFINAWNAGNIRFNSVIGQFEQQQGPGGKWTLLNWEGHNFNHTGWTISYSIATASWVSFHDYIPYMYSYTSKDVLSLAYNDDFLIHNKIWSHSETSDVGNFYGMLYPFEFEFIYTKAKDEDKVFYNFEYIADVYNNRNILLHNQGFTSFYIYTTHQFSGEQPLEYMMNIRRIGNEWKVNKFRDMAALITNIDPYYTGPHTGSNYGVPGANVAGTVTESVVTTQISNMFTVDGMYETVNTTFINDSKSWERRRKFIDKWAGIRLIYSNSTKNLIYLYATDVAARQFYR